MRWLALPCGTNRGPDEGLLRYKVAAQKVLETTNKDSLKRAPNMNEENQFLDDLKDTNDLLEQEIFPQEKKEEDIEPEDAPESVKDRRHRRLEEKLRAEREANIAMAARLEVLAETKQVVSDAEYLKAVERIYGTDTPEAQTATEILKNALMGVKQEARDEALRSFREEQEQSSQSVAKEESTLDSMIDEIEDEYGVNMTPEMQRGFFTLLERLSPKDTEGNVIEYADHHAVFDEYQQRLKRTEPNRAKDLSARSMTQSGANSEAAQGDANWQILRKELGW